MNDKQIYIAFENVKIIFVHTSLCAFQVQPGSAVNGCHGGIAEAFQSDLGLVLAGISCRKFLFDWWLRHLSGACQGMAAADGWSHFSIPFSAVC